MEHAREAVARFAICGASGANALRVEALFAKAVGELDIEGIVAKRIWTHPTAQGVRCTG